MNPRPEQQSRRSSNIFINYRRDDSAGHAGRLFDRLSSRFPERVFMDIDTIEAGTDFVESIEQAVGCCEVLIVMIGREWLHLTDATGGRRVDNPNDFVRLEIAAALQRNIRIIPVLVDDAVIPRPEDLPPEIARLTRRNAIELSDVRWAFDVDRLIQVIEKVLVDRAPSALLPALKAQRQSVPDVKRARSRTWLVPATLVLLASLGWIGWGQWNLSRQLNLLDAKETGSPTTASVKAPDPQPEPPVVLPEVEKKPIRKPLADSPSKLQQRDAQEKKGRLGSLVRRGKTGIKNIWGKVKSGGDKKDGGRQESRAKNGR